MAIPAVRFKPFNEETNLPITDYAEVTSSDIFNSPNSQLQEVTDGLQDLLDQGNPLQEDVTALTDNLTRATADAFGAVKDITGMIPSDIEKQVATMLPDNPTVQNMFKQLSTECKKRGLGNSHNMRPFKDQNACNSGNGACDKAQIGGLFGKLAGGVGQIIGGIAAMLNRAFNAIISLASLGYDVGFCKVFQALSGAFGMGNNDLLGKAGAVLIGQMANKGNTSAIIDISGQMSGLNPLMTFPGAIGRSVETFNTDGVNLPGMASRLLFADRFEGGMEIMKDNWMRSNDGSQYSIANMGGRLNSNWKGVLDTKASQDWVDEEDLDAVTYNDYAPLSGAYGSMDDFSADYALV